MDGAPRPASSTRGQLQCTVSGRSETKLLPVQPSKTFIRTNQFAESQQLIFLQQHIVCAFLENERHPASKKKSSCKDIARLQDITSTRGNFFLVDAIVKKEERTVDRLTCFLNSMKDLMYHP